MNAHDILKTYFGHDAFRPGQQELISALTGGRDVLGVMPTGAGKSVCYQIPALLTEGTTLVISPLISLMNDQVAALREMGIPAACLNSSLTDEEYLTALRDFRSGVCRLLYVAPERLGTPAFRAAVSAVRIPIVAVDEEHCVSQWGQDFRPEYLRIAEFLASLPEHPTVGAFTATATERVRSDVIRLLGLRDPLTLTTGFDRPNLYFAVEHLREREKKSYLLRFLREHAGQSGIVYCATRKNVDMLYEELSDAGICPARYHGGMEPDERRVMQDAFVSDVNPVMVATNAFGMGIDKSNVSFVIHYNMPKDIESYYQEAGRAGRDGAPAACILLFDPRDVRIARFLIDNSDEENELPPEIAEEQRRQSYARLRRMTAYCAETGCLRGSLLRYFGETPEEECGNCGNCCSDSVRTDVTTDAQKILSAVARAERRYPTSVGEGLIVQLLLGSRDEKVRLLRLDELPTFGAMAGSKPARIRQEIDLLLAQGRLRTDDGQRPCLHLTETARPVLFGDEKVYMNVPAEPSPGKKTPAGGKSRGKRPRTLAEDSGLLARLRELRSSIALERNVPPYMIFTNASLISMAQSRPRTRAELLRIDGVGERKADTFGNAFLAAIAEWETEQGQHL